MGTFMKTLPAKRDGQKARQARSALCVQWKDCSFFCSILLPSIARVGNNQTCIWEREVESKQSVSVRRSHSLLTANVGTTWREYGRLLCGPLAVPTSRDQYDCWPWQLIKWLHTKHFSYNCWNVQPALTGVSCQNHYQNRDTIVRSVRKQEPQRLAILPQFLCKLGL